MIRASKDAEELVQSYRRIDRLFRRLQVSEDSAFSCHSVDLSGVQTDASLGAWSIAHEHLAVRQDELRYIMLTIDMTKLERTT